MSKPGLGRGLDRLMQYPPAASSAPAEADTLAPGLRILVRGNDVGEGERPREPLETNGDKADSPPPGVAAESANANPEGVPLSTLDSRWRLAAAGILVLADIALVFWPVMWVLHRSDVSVIGLLGCAVSLAVAAGAGTLAVLLWRK